MWPFHVNVVLVLLQHKCGAAKRCHDRSIEWRVYENNINVQPERWSLCLTLPADQADGTRAELVHQDAERQRNCTQQEGADGEGQIQHLVLGHAAVPLSWVAVGRGVHVHIHRVVLWGEQVCIFDKRAAKTVKPVELGFAEFSKTMPKVPGS